MEAYKKELDQRGSNFIDDERTVYVMEHGGVQEQMTQYSPENVEEMKHMETVFNEFVIPRYKFIDEFEKGKKL